MKVVNRKFPTLRALGLFLEQKKTVNADKLACPWWTAGPHTNTRAKQRHNKDIGPYTVHVDEQDGGPAIEEVQEVLQEFEAIYYTTYSHDTEANRYRMILSLDRPLAPGESWIIHDFLRWLSASRGLTLRAAREAGDHGRLWFVPSSPKENADLSTIVFNPGKPICVDAVMAWDAAREKPTEPMPVFPKAHDPNSQIGQLNARLDIVTILEDHGYPYVRSHNGGRMLRFGNPFDPDATPGIMVIFNEDGTSRVYSFHKTEACPIYTKGVNQSMDAVGLLVELEYGGNLDALLVGHGNLVEDEPEPAEDEPEPVDSFHALMAECPSAAMRAIYGEYMASARFGYPTFGVAASLIVCGTLMGNRYRHRAGGLLAHLRFQSLGPSSSGKNAPIKIIKSILEEFGLEDMRVDNVASSEGIEDALFRNQGNLMLMIDENYDKLGTGENAGKIRAMLRTLYTIDDGVYSSRVKAEQKGMPVQRKVKAPFLSTWFASTYKSFSAATKEGTIDEGNMGRMFFTLINKRPKDNHQMRAPIVPKVVRKTARRVRAIYDAIHLENDVFIPVDYAPETRALVEDMKDKETEQFNRSTGLAQQLAGRTVEQTIRVAMIAAVWSTGTLRADPDDPTEINECYLIDPVHMKWANRVVKLYQQQAAQLEEHVRGDSDYEQKLKIWARAVWDYEQKRKTRIERLKVSVKTNKSKKEKNRLLRQIKMLEKGIIPFRELVRSEKFKTIGRELGTIERMAVEAETVIIDFTDRQKQTGRHYRIIRNFDRYFHIGGQ